MYSLLRYLSIRYWLGHFGAFCLAALGVALGLAVFVAVQVANHSVLAAFQSSIDAVAGRANLQIRGGHSGLPDMLYPRLKLLDDAAILAAAPRLSQTIYSPTLHKTVLVEGIDPFAERGLRDYGLEPSGSTPSESIGGLLQLLINPRAIAISAQLATAHRLQAGSRIVAHYGSLRDTLQVAAVLHAGQLNQAYGGDFAVMDLAGAQETFGRLGRLSSIDLLVDEAHLDEVARRLRPMVPGDATVERPRRRGQQVAAMLSAFQLNLTALSCIALFVGAFLIYNAISSSIVRRRSQIGILRAIGAGARQLTAMFVAEAAFIGLFGSLIGLLLGIVLARFTLVAVARTVSALYVAVKAHEIVVPHWLWWSAPLGGTLLAVLAALPAAWEAGHAPPRAAMLETTLHQATTRFAWPAAGCGAALLGLAYLLCLPAISERSPLWGFAAAFLTLLGFGLLTPATVLIGGSACRALSERLFGVAGHLGALYLRRALNRASLIIAALMVSLAMMIGLSVMVRSFRDTVGQWVSTTISADLFIGPSNGYASDSGAGLPPAVVRYAEALPQVRLWDTLREAEVEVHGQRVSILANSLPSLRTGDRRIHYLATMGSAAAAQELYLRGGGVLISERFSRLIGKTAGEYFSLNAPGGATQFLIAAVFIDYNPGTALYMPRRLYQRYWHDFDTDGVALYLRPGASAGQVKQDLEQRFGARYQLSLVPNQEIRKQIFNTFDQTFAVTYALQLIAVAVAAIGIFSTLMSLLLERGRELASLRAMGCSAAQLRAIALIEFGWIGIFAWMLGVAAGLCLAWELIFVINRQFFGWTINWSLPPLILLQALGLSLMASLGAGFLPTRAAVQRNIAESLQME